MNTSTKINSFRSQCAFWIATAGGAGLVPRAPGTAGSVVGIPILLFTTDWNLSSRLVFLAGLTLLGIWAAQVFDSGSGTQDNQKIVIDEVIGMYITGWTCPHTWISIAIAFALFRFFDVTKLPPVRQVDRWSKKPSHAGSFVGRWKNGIGVVADDVLAGFQGLIVMLVLQHWGILY